MDAVIYSFTDTGKSVSGRIKAYMEQNSWHVQEQVYEGCGTRSKSRNKSVSLAEDAGLAFQRCQCLIFIGAAGIAVRAIAPHIRSKITDPAVLVLDEHGRFVIPLLSGHIGGANKIAGRLADFLGGQAVWTTATDVNGLFAVDEWAAAKHLVITSMEDAKAFAAAILVQKKAGLYSDFPVSGALPPSLCREEAGILGVAAALRCDCRPFQTTVVVQPRIFHLGIGCRAGISEMQIEAAVRQALAKAAVHEQAVAAVHSVSLKANEPGLIAFCRHHHWPFVTYDAAVLAALPGNFTGSSFVRTVTGVDNVCERAAAAGAHRGVLVLRKNICNGVTCAIAAEPYTLSFV